MKRAAVPSNQRVVAETRAWIEQAVIGLNLCPFAKAPFVKDRVHVVVSEARAPQALLDALCREMQALVAAAPEEVETTLLVHPQVLQEFAAFNDFLGVAEAALEALGHAGVLQIASFHPRYRFAGTRAADIGNATNRAPYPTLHLLREASVERAVAAMPDPEAIYAANIATLEQLGAAGWQALLDRCRAAADAAPTQPKPTQPKATQPQPTQPQPTQPQPIESKPIESKPIESKPTQPKPTQPEA